MRVYETTFIVNPQTDDATIDQHVAAVSDLITGHGGKMLHEDRMGTRRLAYPIKKLTQGYYHSFIYEASNDVLPVLERHFRLNDQYLRFLTVMFEGDLTKLTHERQERLAAEQGGSEDKPRRTEARAEAAEDSESESEAPEETDDAETTDDADDSDDDEEVL
jgi:small subunit ribosomal protein S6